MSHDPKIPEPVPPNSLDNIAEHLRPKDSMQDFLDSDTLLSRCIQPEPFSERTAEDATIKNIPVVDNEINVEVTTKIDQNIKAKRFLELVQGGVAQWDAAKQMGTTIKDLYQTQGMKSAVKRLIETNNLPAAVRKELVRSGLNKIFMENVDGGPKEQKLALQAAKQIASDPDVALNLPPSNISVNVDVSKLNELFKSLKPSEALAGLDIEDVDFEEIKEDKNV